MTLLKYFCKKEVPRCQKLPDRCSPLGQEVGKNLTEEANKEVVLVLENSEPIAMGPLSSITTHT